MVDDYMSSPYSNYKSFCLFDSETRLDLIKKAKDGDKEAKNMVHGGLDWLVINSVKGAIFSWNLDLSYYGDLYTEGHLGINKAITSYDHFAEFEFSTIAGNKIKHTIQRYLENNSRTIRVPVHVQDTVKKIIKSNDTFIKENFREPTSEEISAIAVSDGLDLDVSTIDFYLKTSNQKTTQFSNLDYDVSGYVDFPLERLDTILENLAKSSSLSEREYKVIFGKLGFGEDQEPKTFTKISEELGVSTFTACKDFKEAISKLRKNKEIEDILLT